MTPTKSGKCHHANTGRILFPVGFRTFCSPSIKIRQIPVIHDRVWRQIAVRDSLNRNLHCMITNFPFKFLHLNDIYDVIYHGTDGCINDHNLSEVSLWLVLIAAIKSQLARENHSTSVTFRQDSGTRVLQSQTFHTSTNTYHLPYTIHRLSLDDSQHSHLKYQNVL